jgi:ComEC/Rec2-related protein
MAFGIATAFIAGILIASLGWNIVLVAAGLTAMCGVKRIFLWREVTIFLIALCIGALYYRQYLNWDQATMRLSLGKEVNFTAIISSEPTESAKYESFTADPWHSHELMILAPPLSGLAYGDLLDVQGIIGASDAPGQDPFVASPRITLIAHGHGLWLREWLIDGKLALIKRFNEFLPQDQAALLGGITIGGASGMSAELRNEMAISGTSYILSMYGYKIAAITAVASVALKNFFSRRITFFSLLALIALFVCMTGIIASAVRAGIMAAIALTAKEVGRPFDMRNAIALTAAIMLAFDPLLLMGDVGFQLSFLSVIGIAYLSQPIKRWWRYQDNGFFHWREGVATTLAVLAPMVPLIANADGSFPITAIPSNVLMFLTTPFTVMFGFILAVLGFTIYSAAFVVARIGQGILAFQLAVIKIFSIVSIPLPISFHIPVVIIIYYAGLAMFFFYYDEEN